MAGSLERKVGFFFLAGMLIFGIMLEVGEKWNPFEHKVSYNTYLTSVTGLKVGDSVRLAGVDVGRITKITIIDGKSGARQEVKIPSSSEPTDSAPLMPSAVETSSIVP